MFTVFIAEKEHIDAIRQENNLFFEPFLENKDLAFCSWNPEGQTLSESVPGLFDAVGRKKDWKAVILFNGNDEQLKKQNPFDTVDYHTIADLPKPQSRPATGEKWDAWEESWKSYFRALSPLKEAVYKSALETPLQKLSTWLCFRPSDYVLEDVAEKRNVEDWAMAALGVDEIKPNVRLEKLERDQYRHELRLKEMLRRGLTADTCLNIAYPTELHCISERITLNGFFSPDSYWNIRSDNEYSEFYDRNMYFDKMRFMVFDILPRTHSNFRHDRIRFLFAVMVFAANEIPGSVMQSRHLYLLNSDNDDASLCTLATSYDKKLSATFDVISNQMEKIRGEAPGELSDKEAELLFCSPADVTVPLDKSCNPEALYAENDFGLSSNCPVSERERWNDSYKTSEKELVYIVKQQGRSVKKSVDKLQAFSEVSEVNISRLTSFQMDDVRDYTQDAEDKMVASLPPDLSALPEYLNQMEEKDNAVKTVLKRRMRKRTVIGLGALCLGLYLLCFLPLLRGNVGSARITSTAVIFSLSILALIAIVLLVTLFCLRRPLKAAVSAFNDTMTGILSNVKSSMDRFSQYLSAACNVRRGYAVQNYAEKNLDEYTKSLRIRKRHQEDIRRTRANLAEQYRDFLGDKRYYDETMIQPYEYDFDQKTEYTYPAPFLAGDYRQIEFLASGNYVTVPSSFVTRISVRMEEIYDK